MTRVIREWSCVVLALVLPWGGALLAQSEFVEPPDKGWMGVLLGYSAERSADETTDLAPSGIAIQRIIKDGPADQAGLRAGDVILAVNGHTVGTSRELIRAIGRTAPGSWTAISIERQGKPRDVRVRLGSRPPRGADYDVREGWLGIDSIDLPPPLREHFGATEESGVMVADVEEGSPAFVAGIELGDVITAVNDEDVHSSRHLMSLIGGGGIGNTLEIRLMRSGVEIVLEATIEEQPAELDT